VVGGHGPCAPVMVRASRGSPPSSPPPPHPLPHPACPHPHPSAKCISFDVFRTYPRSTSTPSVCVWRDQAGYCVFLLASPSPLPTPRGVFHHYASQGDPTHSTTMTSLQFKKFAKDAGAFTHPLPIRYPSATHPLPRHKCVPYLRILRPFLLPNDSRTHPPPPPHTHTPQTRTNTPDVSVPLPPPLILLQWPPGVWQVCWAQGNARSPLPQWTCCSRGRAGARPQATPPSRRPSTGPVRHGCVRGGRVRVGGGAGGGGREQRVTSRCQAGPMCV
jgi:hypothetical protein